MNCIAENNSLISAQHAEIRVKENENSIDEMEKYLIRRDTFKEPKEGKLGDPGNINSHQPARYQSISASRIVK